jgi:hypothetical protein
MPTKCSWACCRDGIRRLSAARGRYSCGHRSNAVLSAAGSADYLTDGELTPPDPGARSDNPTKAAAEMRLVAHTALEGHLRQRCLRRQQQFLGSPDASVHNVSDRRLAKGLPKGTKKMACTELHHFGEVSGSDAGIQLLLDVRPDALGLPGRETALQIRVGWRSVSLRTQVDSQQCRCALNATFCRAQIGVQSTICRSQKAGQLSADVELNIGLLHWIARIRWKAACVSSPVLRK